MAVASVSAFHLVGLTCQSFSDIHCAFDVHFCGVLIGCRFLLQLVDLRISDVGCLKTLGTRPSQVVSKPADGHKLALKTSLAERPRALHAVLKHRWFFVSALDELKHLEPSGEWTIEI